MYFFWLVHAVHAQQAKQVRRVFSIREKDCRENICKGLDELDPNCTYKCVSTRCFTTIYGFSVSQASHVQMDAVLINLLMQPLEPGEVDYDRRTKFLACVRDEDRKNTMQA